MLGKNFSRQHFEIFFLFSQKIGFDISCQSLFVWEILEKYSQFVICYINQEE